MVFRERQWPLPSVHTMPCNHFCFLTRLVTKEVLCGVFPTLRAGRSWVPSRPSEILAPPPSVLGTGVPGTQRSPGVGRGPRPPQPRSPLAGAQLGAPTPPLPALWPRPLRCPSPFPTPTLTTVALFFPDR